ncbi:hypothetical protein JTE90_017409 [Oedothorax gibbosus]|uniref:Uncharacterized protein n=1 Tax=Oedothorax gibbosus TaxID=931172 RepID=A0AAV6U5Q1_9ARAC|nr:hypothetical protein JTE90_017409 [Oedothorax gibbosus]
MKRGGGRGGGGGSGGGGGGSGGGNIRNSPWDKLMEKFYQRQSNERTRQQQNNVAADSESRKSIHLL